MATPKTTTFLCALPTQGAAPQQFDSGCDRPMGSQLFVCEILCQGIIRFLIPRLPAVEARLSRYLGRLPGPFLGRAHAGCSHRCGDLPLDCDSKLSAFLVRVG